MSEGEPVRTSAIALPGEHGGWGMLGEPLLLGLLVAPSLPGFGIALAASFAFLARHPLKLAVADWHRRRRTPRTRTAERLALVYTLAGLCGLALARGGAPGWWLPLAAAAPLALVQFGYDVLNRGRRLVAQLAGGIALGCVAAAELVAAGVEAGPAAAAWAIVAVKAAAAILYVRARLRCDRGFEFRPAAVLWTHVLGLGIALALAAAGLLPWLAAAAFGLLLARAVHGLSRLHRPSRPQVVGMMEVAYGIAFVAAAALGFRRGL